MPQNPAWGQALTQGHLDHAVKRAFPRRRELETNLIEVILNLLATFGLTESRRPMLLRGAISNDVYAAGKPSKVASHRHPRHSELNITHVIIDAPIEHRDTGVELRTRTGPFAQMLGMGLPEALGARGELWGSVTWCPCHPWPSSSRKPHHSVTAITAS